MTLDVIRMRDELTTERDKVGVTRGDERSMLARSIPVAMIGLLY